MGTSNKAGIKVVLSIKNFTATDQLGRAWNINSTGVINQNPMLHSEISPSNFSPVFLNAFDNLVCLQFIVPSFPIPGNNAIKSKRMIAIHLYNLKGVSIATPFVGLANVGYNKIALNLNECNVGSVSHGLYIYKIGLC